MADELTALEKEAEAQRLQALEQLAAADRRLAELAEYRRLKAKFESSTASDNSKPNDSNQTETKSHAGPLTMRDLANSYFSDERSPFCKLRFQTRKNYQRNIEAVLRRYGSMKLADINAETIQTIYDEWNASGKVSMAHAKVTMQRLLFSYGTDVLKDPECGRLSFILHRLRFTRSKTQNQQRGPTQEEVAAIIKIAHERNLSSLALAQAFQFECRKLRIKDVLGEWVPLSEQPPSDIIVGNKKWVRGIRWNNIKDLILHHTLSWEGTEVEIDLRKFPMVMAALDKIKQRLGSLPTHGAVIANDKNRLPWDDDAFRKKWRAIADSVGVPRGVRYVDTRTGRRRRSRGPEEEPENGRPASA